MSGLKICSGAGKNTWYGGLFRNKTGVFRDYLLRIRVCTEKNTTFGRYFTIRINTYLYMSVIKIKVIKIITEKLLMLR